MVKESEIVVLPKNGSGLFYKKLTKKNILTRRLNLHRLTRQKSHLVKFIAFFIPELFSLYRLFRKERVDIVHCNGSWQVKGVIAGKLAGAKVVWHLNDTRRIRIIDLFSYLAGKYLCDAFIFAAKRVPTVAIKFLISSMTSCSSLRLTTHIRLSLL